MVKTRVQLVDRSAPWKISNGEENLVLQALQFSRWFNLYSLDNKRVENTSSCSLSVVRLNIPFSGKEFTSRSIANAVSSGLTNLVLSPHVIILKSFIWPASLCDSESWILTFTVVKHMDFIQCLPNRNLIGYGLH
jgi:hypothetical protein